MDYFIFKTTSDSTDLTAIGDIPGESQRLPDDDSSTLTGVWGTNGVALTIGVDPNDLEVMHVDPVIPGFEDPLFG